LFTTGVFALVLKMVSQSAGFDFDNKQAQTAGTTHVPEAYVVT